MKVLITLTLLALSDCNNCFSQLVLAKKNKTVSLDTNRIWGVQTNSVMLLSNFDFKYYHRKDKYRSHRLFLLDTVKTISKNDDSLAFSVNIVQHYKDTSSGAIYSIVEIDNQWKNGNYNCKPVFRDTSFQFALADIQQLQIQTRTYRRTDALGILGIFVMGTVTAVNGAVSLIKGNGDGYIYLGLGVGMWALGKHWLNKGKWLEDFIIGPKSWKIIAK